MHKSTALAVRYLCPGFRTMRCCATVIRMARITASEEQSRRATLERRAEALDALDSVLPFDRRDFLAELLTDDDVETLRHLAKEGIGENSLRALASDLGYLEAWCGGRDRTVPCPGRRRRRC